MGSPEILLKTMRGEEMCTTQVPESQCGRTPERRGAESRQSPVQDASGESNGRERRTRKPKYPTEIYFDFTKRKRNVGHSKANGVSRKQRGLKGSATGKTHKPDAGDTPPTSEPGPGNKLYICADCGQSFDLWPALVDHLSVHNGTKPYACPDCDKSFSYRSALLIHQNTHSGLKPYQCSVCLKRFPRKSSLVVHMRSHTGERPFICNICNKSFIERAKLRRHVRIHTGEKPYRCNTCGKCFNDSSVLIRHEKGHTPGKHEKDKRRRPVSRDPADCAPSARSMRHFRCSECGQDFTGLKWLRTHKVSHAKELNHAGHMYQDSTVTSPETHLSASRECERELHRHQKDFRPRLHESDTQYYISGALSVKAEYECNMLENAECHTHQIPHTSSSVCVKAEYERNVLENAECDTHLVPPISSALNVKTEYECNMLENADCDTHQISHSSSELSVKAEYECDVLENAECHTHQIPCTSSELNVKTEYECDVLENAECDTHQISDSSSELNVKAEYECDVLENAECDTHLVPPTSSAVYVKAEYERDVLENAECDTHQLTRSEYAIGAREVTQQFVCPNQEGSTGAVSARSAAEKEPCANNASVRLEDVTPQATDCAGEFHPEVDSDPSQAPYWTTPASANPARAHVKRAGPVPAAGICAERTVALSKKRRREESDGRKMRCHCDQCGKRFMFRCQLLIHQRSHTEERPFTCAECGKGFKELTKLNRHHITHTGERPFQCADCGKRFNDSSVLKRHSKIHSGKPYKCPECGLGFPGAAALRRHKKTHS